MKNVTCKIQTGAGKFVSGSCIYLSDIKDYPEFDFHVFLRGTVPFPFMDHFRL